VHQAFGIDKLSCISYAADYGNYNHTFQFFSFFPPPPYSFCTGAAPGSVGGAPSAPRFSYSFSKIKQCKAIYRGCPYKICPQSGGGLSSADILRTKRGSSDAERPQFLLQKFRIFRNLWCVRTTRGEGELRQCGRFSDKEEEEVNFSRFCADVFYGRSHMAYFGLNFC